MMPMFNTHTHQAMRKTWVLWSGLLIVFCLVLNGNALAAKKNKYVISGKIVPKSQDLTFRAKHQILTIERGGHTSEITEIFVDSTKRRFFTTSTDKTLRHWDIETGDLLNTFRYKTDHGAKGAIHAADFSNTNNTIALGGNFFQDDGGFYISLLDAESGKIFKDIKAHKDIVTSLKFSADGKKLVAGSRDNSASIIDCSSGTKEFALKGHSGPVYAVSMSANGQFAATGSRDKTIKLWKVARGLLLKTFRKHEAPVRTLAFHPSNESIISADASGKIYRWFFKKDSSSELLSLKHPNIKKIALSPQGEFLAVTFEDSKTVKVFSMATLSLVGMVTSKYGPVDAIHFYTKNEILIASNNGRSILHWNYFQNRIRVVKHITENTITDIAFSKDGKILKVGMKKTSAAGLAEVPDGKYYTHFKLKNAAGVFDFQFLKEQTIRKLNGGSFPRSPQSAYHNDSLHSPGIPSELAHKVSRNSDRVTVGIKTKTGRAFYGTAKGKIYVVHSTTGKIIASEFSHTDRINAIAGSPDGQYAVSASQDNTLKFWDLSSGRLLLTLFILDRKDWIAWIPEGYYTSSLYGDKYVGWNVNTGAREPSSFYTVAQFERIFYRPEVVNQYLNARGNRGRMGAKSKKLLSEYSDIQKFAPANIKILSPGFGAFAGEKQSIPLRFEASSKNLRMTEYNVYINNIPAIRFNDKALKLKEGFAFKRNLSLPILGKKNRIRIEIFNGKSMGVRETLVYADRPRQPKRKGDLYLIAVGINKFKYYQDINLEYAAADATGISRFFLNKGRNQFNKIHIQMLSDDGTYPGKKNIIDSLDILKRASLYDTIIIFLASHGISDKKLNYYFVPADGSRTEIDAVLNPGATYLKSGNNDTLIRWSVFYDTIRNLPGKRILIVDTCQAKGIQGNLSIHTLSKKSASSTYALLAASQADEYSQEYPDGKHGLFTYALLKGLNGAADTNNDSKLTLNEIHQYCAKLVYKLGDKRYGGQTPLLIAPAELSEAIIARH